MIRNDGKALQMWKKLYKNFLTKGKKVLNYFFVGTMKRTHRSIENHGAVFRGLGPVFSTFFQTRSTGKCLLVHPNVLLFEYADALMSLGDPTTSIRKGQRLY